MDKPARFALYGRRKVPGCYARVTDEAQLRAAAMYRANQRLG
jgi:hypothetical protein